MASDKMSLALSSICIIIRHAGQRNSHFSDDGNDNLHFARLALCKKVGLLSEWMAQPHVDCFYRVVALPIVLRASHVFHEKEAGYACAYQALLLFFEDLWAYSSPSDARRGPSIRPFTSNPLSPS